MIPFPAEPATDDPWAWLYESPVDDVVDLTDLDVVGVLYRLGRRSDAELMLAAVNAGSARPRTLVYPENVPAEAGWVWVLTDLCEPEPDALATLLARAAADPRADVIGALTVERRRRGSGVLIREFGQTLSRTGRVRTFAEAGELSQGQLAPRRVLGAPAPGLLVRGSLWRKLGGLNTALPAQLWGLDLGWRANLSGARVVADPDAHVVDKLPYDVAEERAGGLALIAAHTHPGLRLFTWLRLIVMTLLAAVGFVFGKDVARARDEVGGLFGWLRRGKMRQEIRRQLKVADPYPTSVAATKELLPGRVAGLRRALDTIAARFADWLATFTERTGSDMTLDDMIGDDFVEQGRKVIRVPVVLVGIVSTLILAGVAARGTFNSGTLRAPQLFAAFSSWQDMLADYLTPVAGNLELAAPPWEGLTALASLITLGNPGWLVTVLVIGCVPLAWLAAYRLLRQLVGSPTLAALTAMGYALVPIGSGALNQTGFAAAVWAVLLPVAAYAVWWWHSGPEAGTWRGAAAVAVWLLIATAMTPAVWAFVVIAGVVAFCLDRRARAFAQWLFILLVPSVLLIGPWGRTLLAYPGRLLTGIEPTLAGTAEVPAWRVPLLAYLDGGPPLWVTIPLASVAWLAALGGAIRSRRASRYLWVAVGLAIAAMVSTRLLVWAPPGAWMRPTGVEPLLAMAGVLMIAAAVGLDGVWASLKDRSLGLRHLGVFGVTAVSVVALLGGATWWAVAGEAQLTRSAESVLPTYVREDQRSATPGRTLAISMTGDEVEWSLIDGASPRLGEIEHGLALAGSEEALRHAEAVVGRLVSGVADDQLLGDLHSLGVSNIWLSGGDQTVRLGIGNTPGLRAGSGKDAWMVWPVPDSAIAVIESGAGRVRTGNGQTVDPEAAERVLVIAEPPDSRWQASLDGQPLMRSFQGGSGPAFIVDANGGMLRYELAGVSWWAWVQLGVLTLLVVMALPGVRARAGASGPKRVAEEDE